jgi:AcrR family transcriptional regulator
MTIDQIVAAAIAVADDGGLAALSMAAVAQRLGCTKMALYRYVDAKEDLQAVMLDAAIGPPRAPILTTAGWRGACMAWAEAMLDRYRTHPWAVDLPVGSAVMTRNQSLWLEAALTALRPSGLTLAERLSVSLLLSTHVAATERMQRDRAAVGSAVPAPPDPALSFATLTAPLGTGELTEVAEAFNAGHLQDADGDRHEFEFGLTCILDGAQAAASRHRDDNGAWPT